MKRILSAIIAILIGVTILLGYFINVPILVSARTTLLDWGISLAGVAVLLGVANLVSVHLKKIRDREKSALYSLALVVFMLITILLGLVLGMQDPIMGMFFSAILLPVEASMMAILAVTLLYASARLLRQRTDLMSIIFVITAALVFIGLAPIPFIGHLPVISDFLRPYISQVLAAGGARGILMGIALGVLTTGLRILIGADRPYGSK